MGVTCAPVSGGRLADMRVVALVAVVATSLTLTSCSLLPGGSRSVSPPVASVQGLAADAVRSLTLAPTAKGRLSGRTIVVDAGHAGAARPEEAGKLRTTFGGKQVPCYTSGATAPDGTREHTLNHDLALRTAKALRARGATVMLTRTGDTGPGPCNDTRGKTANRAKAHLLLSLHADSDASHKRGYHLIHSPSMRGGTKLQDRSLAAARTLGTALRSTPIPPANYKGTPDSPTDARTNMAILNELTGTPGVLVEIGNLNNADDWALIARPATRDALAEALAHGAEQILAPTRKG